MTESSKEDLTPENQEPRCVHDRGTDWSYYPANNYDTQKTYSKSEKPECPWCSTKENQSDEDLKKENLDEWVDECASCGRKVMVVRLSTIITVDSKRLVFCNLVCAKKVYKETR